MTAPEHERIINLPVPVQPLCRRRSRLGEPTVRIELVVIDNNGQLGKQLLRRQAAAMKKPSSGSPTTQQSTNPHHPTTLTPK